MEKQNTCNWDALCSAIDHAKAVYSLGWHSTQVAADNCTLPSVEIDKLIIERNRIAELRQDAANKIHDMQVKLKSVKASNRKRVENKKLSGIMNHKNWIDECKTLRSVLTVEIQVYRYTFQMEMVIVKSTDSTVRIELFNLDTPDHKIVLDYNQQVITLISASPKMPNFQALQDYLFETQDVGGFLCTFRQWAQQSRSKSK